MAIFFRDDDVDFIVFDDAFDLRNVFAVAIEADDEVVGGDEFAADVFDAGEELENFRNAIAADDGGVFADFLEDEVEGDGGTDGVAVRWRRRQNEDFLTAANQFYYLLFCARGHQFWFLILSNYTIILLTCQRFSDRSLVVPWWFGRGSCFRAV